MTAFVGLARRYPKAVLIFTGGNAEGATPTEAAIARKLFVELGLDPNRVRFEDRSRNTHENATLSRRLVTLAPHDAWILVTSAADMPRAVWLLSRRRMARHPLSGGLSYKAFALEHAGHCGRPSGVGLGGP